MNQVYTTSADTEKHEEVPVLRPVGKVVSCEDHGWPWKKLQCIHESDIATLAVGTEVFLASSGQLAQVQVLTEQVQALKKELLNVRQDTVRAQASLVAQLVSALEPFAVYGRPGSRDIEVSAAIKALDEAKKLGF